MDKFMCWLREWDWRPLARLIIWTLIAAHLGYISKAGLAHLGRELVLSWLLTFGILTHLQLILLMGCVRLYLTADDAAYWFSSRIAESFIGDTSFITGFLAAFGLEIALVLSAAWGWRTLDLGSRLLEFMR